MRSDSRKAIKIIKDNLYLTISVSSKNGEPWIANLYYAYDKDFNFYWYSPKNSLHSSLIRKNPRVAIAIFNSTATGDEVDAVYIKAKAFEITEKKELLKGLLCYGKKMLKSKFVNGKQAFGKFINQYKDFQGNSELRMYKAIPEKFWELAPSEIFNGKFVDGRLEISLR